MTVEHTEFRTYSLVSRLRSRDRSVRNRASQPTGGCSPAVNLLAAVALALAGCGGSGSVDSPPPAASISIPPVPADSIARLVAAAGAPMPANLDTFVKNTDAAIQLGKALFWDMQVGSDGEQACASCHHHAGADARVFNMVHAGPFASGVPRGAPLLIVPDGTLTAGLFPLPLAVNDVVASQGVVRMDFVGIVPGLAVEQGIPVVDPLVGTSRQVQARNAPTVIDAVFNLTNFLDGRANQVFNGVDASGTPATLNVDDGAGIIPFAVPVIQPASLASQAMSPPNNPVEMSWAGRTFPELGRKLLSLKPLGRQSVHPFDSVLGNLSAQREPDVGDRLGLTVGYREMIMAAFQDRFWNSSGTVSIVTRGVPADFNLMEANFSLFWGLSIQLYESILVSNQSPFDTGTMTARQTAGQGVFNVSGCAACHPVSPARFTAAALKTSALPALQFENAGRAFADIGVRPIPEDPGLVASAAALAGTAAGNAKFKTAGLRNVELTGPYFHNGSAATLRQVVDFYARGGDFRVGANAIPALPGLTAANKDELVDFMLALTDERVRTEKAPFDHPSLAVPNGPSLPAVGMDGGAPVQRFLGLDPFAP